MDTNKPKQFFGHIVFISLNEWWKCSNCKADKTPPPNCPDIDHKHADTSFLTWKPCNAQTAQRVNKQVWNGRSAPLHSFSGTVWLDVFLWAGGAQRHFTCVKLIHVPVWRLDGQIAANLESLVWLLNSGAGRNPAAQWTPTSQPGHICKRHRLTGQTDQIDFAGLELSTGWREDCQDGGREARAWKYMEDIKETINSQIINTKHDSSRVNY